MDGWMDGWMDGNLVSLTKTDSRYGYHAPRTAARDNYYKKLEEQRAAKQL